MLFFRVHKQKWHACARSFLYFVHPKGLGRYTTSIPFGYILLSVEFISKGFRVALRFSSKSYALRVHAIKNAQAEAWAVFYTCAPGGTRTPDNGSEDRYDNPLHHGCN